MSEYNLDTLLIKPVLEGNKLHYQTDPYVDEKGKVKIKRLTSIDVEIINMEPRITQKDIDRLDLILKEGK